MLQWWEVPYHIQPGMVSNMQQYDMKCCNDILHEAKNDTKALGTNEQMPASTTQLYG